MFLQKHREMNNIEIRPGSGRPPKITGAVKALVERQMWDDDETTVFQLHALLLRHDHTMTLKTVLRCRAALGWMFRGSGYYHLIRQQNKVKHLQWAQEHLSQGVAATGHEGAAATGRKSFFNVLFSDKSFCIQQPVLSLLWGVHPLVSRGRATGDPLGPLLFCLTIHDMLQQVNCEFGVFYLDDGSLEEVG